MDDFLKITAALTPLLLGVMTYYQAKASRNAVLMHADARKAASAVNEVKMTLAETTGQTTEKLDEIHTLVNSRLTSALEKIDRLEARLQALTGETPTGEPPAEAEAT